VRQNQFTVRWSALARDMLISIRDRRVGEKIVEQVRLQEAEPEKQGKPLIGELSGYRSLRAAGQRYRIIYRIEKEKAMVWVMALGIRKEGSKRDIYTLARKLISLYFNK
jgi:mRNA interferase RelE/StbE